MRFKTLVAQRLRSSAFPGLKRPSNFPTRLLESVAGTSPHSPAPLPCSAPEPTLLIGVAHLRSRFSASPIGQVRNVIPLENPKHRLSAVLRCAVGACSSSFAIFAMSAAQVPVSPGSVPPISVNATDSIWTGGSAYDLEGELGAQMDREELAQMGYQPMSPPDEFGGSAQEPPGVEYGDDLEFDDPGMNGWGSHPATTYDASAYTAHQDFLRAAAQFVSPMGYDIPSPNDEVSDNPLGQQAAAPPAWSTEESAFDAFTRQAGMGASSMGYDQPSPDDVPEGYAPMPGHSPAPSVDLSHFLPATAPTSSTVPGGYASNSGPVTADVQANVDMNDSSKRGRAPGPPYSTASSVSAAKRPAVPTASGTAAASSPTTQAPPPLQDARVAALTDEVAALKLVRADLNSKVLTAESEALVSRQRLDHSRGEASQAIGLAQRNEHAATSSLQVVRTELADFLRQAEAFKGRNGA